VRVRAFCRFGVGEYHDKGGPRQYVLIAGTARVDGMSDKPKSKPTLSEAGQRAAQERRHRLAKALRDNLQKRKMQERERSKVQQAPDLDGSDGGGGGKG